MISGSHGLVGTALLKSFEGEGHEVIRLRRTFSEPLDFSGIDAVIHLAGESIAEGRWNSAKKLRIKESRVNGTQKLSEQIAESKNKPGVFISASAIGYYGNRNDEILTEESSAGSGFLPDICKQWEGAAQDAAEERLRIVTIRTGIVLDSHGGALHKMLTPFKMGGGGILGNGRQYMSWISLDDMISSIQFIIHNESIQGPINLTAPNPVTNRDFTKILGRVLRRPTIIPLPACAARILFGEMADALLLSSTRVKPYKLINNGYKFIHENLNDALKDILK